MHFQVLSSGDVRWVLALLAAEVLARLTEGVSHAGYRATGDYALHVGIFYSTLLAQSALVWIVAAAGFGPVFAAAAILDRSNIGDPGRRLVVGPPPSRVVVRADACET